MNSKTRSRLFRESGRLCRMAMRTALGLALLAIAPETRSEAPAKEIVLESPSFSADGRLTRPTDYREWVFVTSGLGMTYGPAKAGDDNAPRFDNVYVTRLAYREFIKSGKWPDKTMFVLEVRKAESNVSINNGGCTQGELVAIEAAVKDRTRYPDAGWAYFSFDGPKGLENSAKSLPVSASCYSCHKAHAAVDNTFVQFYPTLFDVAKRKDTVKPGYDPAGKR